MNPSPSAEKASTNLRQSREKTCGAFGSSGTFGTFASFETFAPFGSSGTFDTSAAFETFASFATFASFNCNETCFPSLFFISGCCFIQGKQSI